MIAKTGHRSLNGRAASMPAGAATEHQLLHNATVIWHSHLLNQPLGRI